MHIPQPLPEVGMGATLSVGSDRYPFTVTEVRRAAKTGKIVSIAVQEDTAIRTDDRGGFTEQQDYRYERDPSGRVLIARQRTDGAWRIEHSKGRGVGYITLGVRRKYRDPSF